MSRLDPNIPLQVKPFQGPNFGRAYQEAQSLRDISQQRQLRSIQIEGAQGQLDDQRTGREREAALLAIAGKHRKQDEAGNPTVDYTALIDELNQGGFFTEARQLQSDQANVETLISARRKRQREEETEVLTDFKKDLQDVVATGNQQKYAIVKAKALKLGLDAPPEAPVEGGEPQQPGGPPKMFREGGKEWITGMLERVNGMVMSEKEIADTQKSKADLEVSNKKLADEKKTSDDWAKDLGYADMATAPKFIQDQIRKKTTGIETVEPKTSQWEADDKVLYDAYAAKLKKTPDKLTAQEKLDAKKKWRDTMNPRETTDFDKRLGLYQKDPDTYNAIYGRATGNVTNKDMISARNRIMANVTRMRAAASTEDEVNQYYADEQEYYGTLGIELPDLSGDAAVVEPKPLSPMTAKAHATRNAALPKPTQTAGVATDATYDAYFAVHKDHAKAIQAMEAAGWK